MVGNKALLIPAGGWRPMTDEKNEMKDEILTFKVSGEEAAMIRRTAAKEGVSVSHHIRTAVLYASYVEGDPVALRVFKEGVSKAVKELFTRVSAIQPKRGKARS